MTKLNTLILTLLLHIHIIYTQLIEDNNTNINNTAQRLPHAIIIGVKKAGTRALLEYLRLNEHIMAPGPEVHFFDRHYERGLAWYKRQMPYTNTTQLTIEKTPSYFITKHAPQRVFEMNKNVKLLIVVRDPVTRALSDYAQTASKRVGMSSFEQMAINSTTGEINNHWGAIKLGIYVRHTQRWLKYFPLSQMHFVSGEDLIYEPVKAVNEVEQFLGLESKIRHEDFQIAREKHKFPCIFKRNVEDNKAHCLGKTKGREHPIVDENVLHKLRQFYEPFNEKFYSLIHRRFNW